MEPKIAAVAGAPDLGPHQFPANSPAPTVEQEKATSGSDPVDLRLVIEVDQASGSYVYKTIDRRTGEVVQQLPRADVLQLKARLQYAAGMVIRTKA